MTVNVCELDGGPEPLTPFPLRNEWRTQYSAWPIMMMGTFKADEWQKCCQVF